ncbi:MAG: stalk domain-containing protein, partial [Hydrogenophaga sp.]|uniref:copper amine oxidase n=1 Tax=Hydrogenophaga sp. TaxID=1904254 RepID=UPI003D9B4B5B
MNTRPLPLALSAVALATAALWAPQALAHGGAAQMVPLKKAAQDANATVQWDSFAQLFTVSRNSTLVRVKPGASTAQVNGAPLRLSVPVVMRKGQPYVSHDFFQQVLQSGLDKTFVVERKPNPLNPLTADEIKTTLDALKASGQFKPGYRFTEIVLKAPPKDQVWAHALEGKPVQAPRQASFVILDGRKLIEGTVDLASKKVLQWQPVEGAHGMVLIDDFAGVQAAIEASPEYAQALKLRGINDVKKVVATPLTVGYFDGKDGLKQEQRLLKVVSYLDVGDNNYWAHPIENLVAVVDLEQKKVIKIEDAGVIPVPMKATPYDGSAGARAKPHKPLHITEPEGKNYTITGNTLNWRNWDFHIGLNSRTGLTLSTVTYNDKGTKRKVLYEGTLGGMIVPYGDPDVGWYFKAYLDSGEYG